MIAQPSFSRPNTQPITFRVRIIISHRFAISAKRRDYLTSFQKPDHFARLRESSRLFLRVNQFAIRSHLENAPASRFEFRLNPERILQFSRQTDSIRFIVSDRTILDVNLLHDWPPYDVCEKNHQLGIRCRTSIRAESYPHPITGTKARSSNFCRACRMSSERLSAPQDATPSPPDQALSSASTPPASPQSEPTKSSPADHSDTTPPARTPEPPRPPDSA